MYIDLTHCPSYRHVIDIKIRLLHIDGSNITFIALLKRTKKCESLSGTDLVITNISRILFVSYV